MKKRGGADNKPIYKVLASPNDASKKEGGLFRDFLKVFLPRVRQQEDLALKYEEAKVVKAMGEGELAIEEANKLAAEIDRIKQEDFKMFCETIDAHLKDMDPALSQSLKLAKLLDTNPQIADKLKTIQEMMAKMAATDTKIYVSVEEKEKFLDDSLK